MENKKDIITITSGIHTLINNPFEEEYKIIWNGAVFTPTGFGTVNREMCREILNRNIKIQTTDLYSSKYYETIDLKNLWNLNLPIDINKGECVTINCDYPMNYKFYTNGLKLNYLIHEGTKVFPEWINIINKTSDVVLTLSEASKNMLKYNGVYKPIEVIPAGVNKDCIINKKKKKNKDFVFLYVNSWTGEENDRKGLPELLKAFVKEFKPTDKVILFIKVSTFWAEQFDVKQAILKIIGEKHKKMLDKIYFDNSTMKREELIKLYQNSDCFVSPTKGEGFGLTICEAMACGLPVIVTKDKNSGHYDFTQNLAYWIETDGLEQGDRRFFCEGNMFPKINISSLQKQLRYAYTHKKELKVRGMQCSEFIREKYTWEKSVNKLLNVIDKYKNETI